MRVNEYFDHVYCLNLDRRQDRWEKISKRFNELEIQVERFSAIDGDSLPCDVVSKFKINKWEVGCLLSHYKIIEDAKENNYKRILVFEDDVLFINDFNEKFEKMTTEVRRNWKLLYLGATQCGNWENINFLMNFYYCTGTDGLFAYGVDSSVYDDILEHRSGIVDRPIDTVIQMIQQKYYGHCYVCFPYLVIADISDSNIRKPDQDILGKMPLLRWDLSKYDPMPYVNTIEPPLALWTTPYPVSDICTCGCPKEKTKYNLCQQCQKFY